MFKQGAILAPHNNLRVNTGGWQGWGILFFALTLVVVVPTRVCSQTVEYVADIRIAQPVEVPLRQSDGEEIYLRGYNYFLGAHPNNVGFGIVDYIGNQIIYVEPEKGWARPIGRYGHGPGEWVRVVGIRFDQNGNSYTYDQFNPRLQKLDNKWLPVATARPAFGGIRGLDVLKENVLILTRSGYTSAPYVIYDMERDAILGRPNVPDRERWTSQDQIVWAENDCLARVVGDSLIAVVYTARREIEVYGIDGTFLASHTIIYEEDEPDYQPRPPRRDEHGRVGVRREVEWAEAIPGQARLVLNPIWFGQRRDYHTFYSLDLPEMKAVIRYTGSPGDYGSTLRAFAINSNGQILGISGTRVLFWADGLITPELD